MDFPEWSKKRLEAVEWTYIETYHSAKGEVTKVLGNGWVGRVLMPDGRMGRIREVFDSAEVAKGAVERTWKKIREVKEV